MKYFEYSFYCVLNQDSFDCGSMVLKIFEDSAHVGGVVLSNEEEKCKNLFKMLNGMIIQRKKVLSSKGVGNYAAYLEAGYTDMPLAVVAIDKENWVGKGRNEFESEINFDYCYISML